jgi:hypothetical protein
MSHGLVEGAFRNINYRDQTLLSIQQHDSKHFLIEKLHIGTGSIDRFRIIKGLGTSVLTLSDHRHRKSSHHCLGFALWQELTQLLKGSTGQGLDGTEVADQSRSCRFLTDKQRQMLHPR